MATGNCENVGLLNNDEEKFSDSFEGLCRNLQKFALHEKAVEI